MRVFERFMNLRMDLNGVSFVDHFWPVLLCPEIPVKTILAQFDTDPLPSTFDQVAAIDAGVDQLFSYGSVSPDNVTGLVHGMIFTRGPADLKNSAIFIGGSDVAAGETLFRKVSKTFFGPMRVSIMMDSNGCNTTAAAAIASARKHLKLAGCRAIVLGATGPVGIRAAELLAHENAQVTLVSRTIDRAEAACRDIRTKLEHAQVTAANASLPSEFEALCHDSALIIAAGAAGVCFLESGALQRIQGVKLAIDLNAVPPAGIADISVMDKAVVDAGIVRYGAVGVGGLKMKIHKKAITTLFESSDRVLDLRAVYELALQVAGIGI